MVGFYASVRTYADFFAFHDLADEQAARERQTELDGATQKLATIEARIHVLSQLQDKLARGADMEGWQASRNLDKAPRLWQGVEIAAGWEDALEAVLRERLNGITLDRIDSTADWLSASPPGKVTVPGPN